jgi:hypothetical protein
MRMNPERDGGDYVAIGHWKSMRLEVIAALVATTVGIDCADDKEHAEMAVNLAESIVEECDRRKNNVSRLPAVAGDKAASG